MGRIFSAKLSELIGRGAHVYLESPYGLCPRLVALVMSENHLPLEASVGSHAFSLLQAIFASLDGALRGAGVLFEDGSFQLKSVQVGGQNWVYLVFLRFFPQFYSVLGGGK